MNKTLSTAILMATWIALTSSTEISELLLGAVVSYTIAHLTADSIPSCPGRTVSVAGIFRYMAVLMKNLVKSNIEITRRILRPKIEINPGIVAIDTKLKCDIEKLILANSITLTPGTLTLDISGETLYVHTIDIGDGDRERLAREIKEEFEKAIGEMTVDNAERS
jgi:multicomponent Na+:H+ antiporter subunit E